MIYQFRAECQPDVDELRQLIPADELIDLQVTPDPAGFPDVEVKLEQNPLLRRLQSQSEPYIINEPERLSFANSADNTDFASLLERLPTRSNYLRSLDHGKIRYRAQYWPESAVQAAIQSLTLSAEGHQTKHATGC